MCFFVRFFARKFFLDCVVFWRMLKRGEKAAVSRAESRRSFLHRAGRAVRNQSRC